LQELRQRQIKATFFVVGKQVRDHPNVLKRAYDEGHEIALHSW
jgi:peptidoglycan/xylan/chitin deacetylase (PgdA/CDA1 family)